MRPWHLGNTTVRSPFRLRDGLVALSTSSLQGNLRGEEQERAFRRLLGEHGIVELGDDDTYSVGRKWRSALNKLGFLYPEVPPASGIPQSEIGPIDMITPNGWRLIRADTVPAMQECFLRALAAHYIPSALERKFDFAVFSPLRHTLAIMLELEKQTGESRLNFVEMAIVVQLTSSDEPLADLDVERWYPLRRWFALEQMIGAPYQHIDPIRLKLGIEMMSLWYHRGPGHDIIRRGADFLHFQTGSTGIISVIRGPRELVGSFDLREFDAAAGRAVIQHQITCRKTLVIHGAVLSAVSAGGMDLTMHPISPIPFC